jgi:UDP-N-acetylmuramoyl-tripeptide--D-alanyl-D-alanine ligase
VFELTELLKATNGILTAKGKAAGLKGISIDSRNIGKDEVFFAIKGNNFDGHDFIPEAIRKGAKAVIFHSDKWSKDKLAKTVSLIRVKDTTKALGDLARFHRNKFDIPVIVVTGSNGKTTTKEMIASVLSAGSKVLKNEGTKNNHIGLPLTLLKLNESYDFVVLEAGSNHPGEIEYLAGVSLANICVITNIGPSHLEFFGNLKGVFKEKYALTKYLKDPFIAVFNADDEFLKQEVASKAGKPLIFGFGLKSKADFCASRAKTGGGKTEFFVNAKYRFTLETIGYYNIYNALAAIAIGRIFGRNYKAIAESLSHFDFPKSRLKVFSLDNVKFIDDTYNSNPLSLNHALDALGRYKTFGRKIFVMGDMLELGGVSRELHREAGMRVAKVCDAFIAVGRFSKETAAGASSFGLDQKNIFTCKTSEEARKILFEKLSPKSADIVLIKGSRLLRMEEILVAGKTAKRNAV